MASDYALVYWDASAILSVLFNDSHTPAALEWAEREGIHLDVQPCLGRGVRGLRPE